MLTGSACVCVSKKESSSPDKMACRIKVQKRETRRRMVLVITPIISKIFHILLRDFFFEVWVLHFIDTSYL